MVSGERRTVPGDRVFFQRVFAPAGDKDVRVAAWTPAQLIRVAAAEQRVFPWAAIQLILTLVAADEVAKRRGPDDA